jgi:S1-C subfamily serine protease
MKVRALVSSFLVLLSVSTAIAKPAPKRASAATSAAVPKATATVDEKLVAHSFFDHAAGDLQLARAANGWKLAAIGKSSLLVNFGLRDGDLVLSIGGKDIKTGAELRAAWEAFQADRQVVVMIERASGKLELTLHYSDGGTAPIAHDFGPDVKVIDDHTFELSRARIEALLDDPATLSRSARVVPSIKEGKANGFKLYAIRLGSLWDACGFQNGDTIRRVNGMDLSSPDKALEMYQKIKNAETITVELTRRGVDRVHIYRIVK